MRCADNCTFFDARNSINNLLNLNRINIQTTNNNEIFFTSGKCKPSCFIKAAEIAGDEKTVLCEALHRFRLISPIAVKDVWPFDLDITNLSNGKLTAFGAGDANIDAVQRVTNTARDALAM